VTCRNSEVDSEKREIERERVPSNEEGKIVGGEVDTPEKGEETRHR